MQIPRGGSALCKEDIPLPWKMQMSKNTHVVLINAVVLYGNATKWSCFISSLNFHFFNDRMTDAYPMSTLSASIMSLWVDWDHESQNLTVPWPATSVVNFFQAIKINQQTALPFFTQRNSCHSVKLQISKMFKSVYFKHKYAYFGHIGKFGPTFFSHQFYQCHCDLFSTCHIQAKFYEGASFLSGSPSQHEDPTSPWAGYVAPLRFSRNNCNYKQALVISTVSGLDCNKPIWKNLQ